LTNITNLSITSNQYTFDISKMTKLESLYLGDNASINEIILFDTLKYIRIFGYADVQFSK
jgi:hypothetical protein